MTEFDQQLSRVRTYGVKIANALYSAQIPFERGAIREAILHKKVDLLKFRNFGRKSFDVLCSLVGLELSPQQPRLKVKCPHCQAIFDLKENRERA